MARIGVIGGGAFGTAMACVLRRAAHDVVLWAREPEVVAWVNEERINPLFLAGIGLADGICATADLRGAVHDAELLLIAVPAQHLRGVARAMRAAVAPATPIVTCSKGMERGSCALMHEVIAQELPRARVAVLSGPSFAREIAAGLPCGVALACADAALARRLAAQIGHARFCVQPSDDVTGTALGGVMKNVIAIASGVAAGRRLGENARATLVTFGLAETTRLGVALGARAETFLGLAGAGDMMLTASSLQSRNTSLGVALGEGKRARDVLAARKEVTEGAASAAAVVQLAQRHGLAMPLAEAVDQVVNRDADLDAVIARLSAQGALG